MARSQNFGGTGGTGASMTVLHFAAISPTVRSATPFACLSRGGVGSIRYPNLPMHAANSRDRYDFSGSTRMNRSIGLSWSGAGFHSGWDSNKIVICSDRSSAPRSLVYSGYTRCVVRSVSRSPYFSFPAPSAVCVYASSANWLPGVGEGGL